MLSPILIICTYLSFISLVLNYKWAPESEAQKESVLTSFKNGEEYAKTKNYKINSRLYRNKINYDGLIFSDDLTMLGAGGEPCSEKARKSIQAGCDMVLVCNNRKEIDGVINLFDELGIEPSERLSKMKKSTNIDWNELNNSNRKNNINIKLEKIRS